MMFMKFKWSILGSNAVLLVLLLMSARGAWAQDACAGALIPVIEGPGSPSLGSATGCGVLITVTAVDGNGAATAFSVSIPNGGNGNPYDGAEDTVVGIQNSSGLPLYSITLNSPNLMFGGVFAFNGDGPCNFALSQYNSGQDCFDGTYGYEGPDNEFSNITGPTSPFCGELACATTGTINFFGEGGLASGSSSWFALEGTPASLTLAQQAVLTFSPTQTSAIATFNCSSGLTPCPDQGAHSMKFTLNSVSSSFSVVLVATQVDGDGVCESGIPGDPSDPIDCRFVTFFGEPAAPPAVNVPLCYPYSSTTSTAPFHCVFYSVQGAPPAPGLPGSPYTSPVLEQIAWNTVFTPPTDFVNSPRMYDDPSDDADLCNCYPIVPGFPYTPEDNQFVFDITTFFNPNPGTVGVDPTTGGKTKSFNDFVIAFPRTIAQIQQPVNADGSSVFNAKRGVVPIKFNFLQDGSASCNLPAATITLYRLSGSDPVPVDESLYSMSADSGSNFRISGCQYIYNLAASTVGPGEYKVGVVIKSKVVGIAYFALK